MMRKTILAIISLIIPLATASVSYGQYYKKQDANYVSEWCSKNSGMEQKKLKNGLRPDCTTEQYVVEVDSVVKWEKNLDQAIGYGKFSGKKAKFVAVLEDPSQEHFLKAAQEKVRLKNLPVEIERLENFKSKEQSMKEIKGHPVILSMNNKCHVKGCGSYGQTKHIKKGYSNLADCINDGGKPAGNLSDKKIWACEKIATGHSSKSKVVKTEKRNYESSAPNVKLSNSGNKCHAKGSRYYNQTKYFKPFKTMGECLKYSRS